MCTASTLARIDSSLVLCVLCVAADIATILATCGSLGKTAQCLLQSKVMELDFDPIHMFSRLWSTKNKMLDSLARTGQGQMTSCLCHGQTSTPGR